MEKPEDQGGQDDQRSENHHTMKRFWKCADCGKPLFGWERWGDEAYLVCKECFHMLYGEEAEDPLFTRLEAVKKPQKTITE